MADHHLVLDTNQVQQVLNILGTRPFNEVAPLIQKIAAQLQAPAANESARLADGLMRELAEDQRAKRDGQAPNG